MALITAVQGAIGTGQQITWLERDSTPHDMTGGVLTGYIKNYVTDETRPITGILTITDIINGVFTWEYSEEDVIETGYFEAQFVCTHDPDMIDITLVDTWIVAPGLSSDPTGYIDSKFFDSVRAAIDISLTDDIIPDSVISLPIYQGAAESYVEIRDPLSATRVGIERLHIYKAIVFLTAAYLVPSVPFLLREDFGDYNYSRFLDKGHVERLVASLRQRSNAELNEVLGLDVFGSMPTMFGVAPGYRGRT